MSTGTADLPARCSPRTRRLRRTLLAVLVVLVAAQVGGFGVSYLAYARPVVSTDNAQVDGDQIAITAPDSGILTRWVAVPGTQVRADEIVGRVALLTMRYRPQVTIRAPGSGVVAVTTVVDGQYVRQGTRLAVAVDPDRVYVTARLDQGDIGRVRVGQPVDIDVAGRSDAPLHGVVRSIRSSTAGELQRFPSIDIDPSNPQPVQQYVPVRIALTDRSTGPDGAPLLPGTSARVHIHVDD